MRVLAVLDLLGGVVVRGVGGRREEYRPVVSRWTASCQPLDVARALRGRFGLEEVYLADLDAIAGAAPAAGVYDQLRREGFRLWVDAGLRGREGVGPLAEAGVETVVAGLETLAGPEALAELAAMLGPRLVFSLDLKGGRTLGGAGWGGQEARAIVRAAAAAGVGRVLVLDLARVGEGQGTGTEELCRELVRTWPGLEVSAGGGVRGVDDLVRLRACGVAAVLAASALHDGRLGPEDLAAVR